ncbi:MAG: hypothetical protein JNL70_10415 [Saprospiraceae bacterium]|nr:hypothetical protein [Saprospiraceae bacterium]
MNNLGLYGLAFLIATVKFLFAASIMSPTALTTFEIAIVTCLGALFSFNIFYWSAGFFMRRAKEKKLRAITEGSYKPKPNFTKVNKFMVKTKRSKSGFWLLCIFAPLFLSVPIGSIVVAKFYSRNKRTYPLVTVVLVVWAFVLAYLNGVIFSLFG